MCIRDSDNTDQNRTNLEIVERRQQRRLDVERQLQRLVEDYNKLIDEERYPEAELIAAQAMDLDPNSVISTLLFEKSRAQSQLATHELIEQQKQQAFLNATNSTNRSSITNVTTENSVVLGDRDRFLQKGRIRREALEQGRYSSEAEARIWNQLRNEQVQGCLLYTSPSPRDATLSRMPSSA